MGYLIDNQLDKVDKPKRAKRLLPSVTEEDVHYLISKVDRKKNPPYIEGFQ